MHIYTTSYLELIVDNSYTAVAIEYISTSLLEKMKTSTVVEFDEFYR